MFERLMKSPKSLAVWSMILAALMQVGWPAIEAASNGMFGENARPWAAVIMAVAGIFGWAVPQKSVSGKKP